MQKTYADVIESVYCDLAVAKGTFYPRNLAFVVQKDWPFQTLINEV